MFMYDCSKSSYLLFLAVPHKPFYTSPNHCYKFFFYLFSISEVLHKVKLKKVSTI